MITNRDAKATRITSMTETELTTELTMRGYNPQAIETYIADARRWTGSIVTLLDRETLRYLPKSSTFILIIPAEEAESYPPHVCISQPCPICGQVD